jgi:hypothetical protein
MNSSQNGGVGEVNRRYADVVELHTAIVERSLANRMADSPRSRVAFGAWSLFAKAREICRKVFPFRPDVSGLGQSSRNQAIMPSRRRSDLI